MTKLTEKRIQHNNYLAKFPADRLTSFHCDACQVEIGTLKPEKGEARYSSAVFCPDCENIMFKFVYDDGLVHITAMP